MLTPQEEHIINMLRDVWNEFQELPVQHPNDTLEFLQVIHQAQNAVLARPAARQLRDNEES